MSLLNLLFIEKFRAEEELEDLDTRMQAKREELYDIQESIRKEEIVVMDQYNRESSNVNRQ